MFAEFIPETIGKRGCIAANYFVFCNKLTIVEIQESKRRVLKINRKRSHKKYGSNHAKATYEPISRHVFVYLIEYQRINISKYLQNQHTRVKPAL